MQPVTPFPYERDRTLLVVKGWGWVKVNKI